MTCIWVAASKLGVGGPATSRTELGFLPRRVALAGGKFLGEPRHDVQVRCPPKLSPGHVNLGMEGQEDILDCAADDEVETTAEPGGPL
eukprot:1093425-Pyramimonas_sp.AAC.1